MAERSPSAAASSAPATPPRPRAGRPHAAAGPTAEPVDEPVEPERRDDVVEPTRASRAGERARAGRAVDHRPSRWSSRSCVLVAAGRRRAVLPRPRQHTRAVGRPSGRGRRRAPRGRGGRHRRAVHRGDPLHDLPELRRPGRRRRRRKMTDAFAEQYRKTAAEHQGPVHRAARPGSRSRRSARASCRPRRSRCRRCSSSTSTSRRSERPAEDRRRAVPRAGDRRAHRPGLAGARTVERPSRYGSTPN